MDGGHDGQTDRLPVAEAREDSRIQPMHPLRRSARGVMATASSNPECERDDAGLAADRDNVTGGFRGV